MMLDWRMEVDRNLARVQKRETEKRILLDEKQCIYTQEV
jgi:hypothetical protein